jgi:SAM-dependent methyltransferase
VVRGLLWAAAALLTIAATLQWTLFDGAQFAEARTLLWNMGGWFGVTGLLMIASSRWGKLQARDRLLDALHLPADGQVLDLGCGHGLLLIGAAKRTPDGRAVGIDIWSQVDQQDNSRAAALANARLEGVLDRVEITDGDIRQLPFPDAGFDAVIACLVLHNIHPSRERGRALAEMARVLRPGGQVALIDIRHVREYAAGLANVGIFEISTVFVPWIFPPARMLTGRKVPG